MTSFVDAMSAQEVDFIIQLGDFCIPDPGNDEFMTAWNKFTGPRYHVLGNHDMDGGHSRERVVEYYGMPHRCYSFGTKGVHFVVLDGNDPGGSSQGYARFVGAEQLEWLRSDLEAHPLPTVVFIHQPLDSTDGVDNRAQVRATLESAGRSTDHPGVVAVFAGHSHVDYCRFLGGIHYALINSASYQWVGSDYRHESYSPEIHQEFPSLDRTCPYRDPLWAVVSLDLEKGAIEIEGCVSEWVGPSPVECGVDFESGYWGWDPRFCQPRVSTWRFPMRSEGELGQPVGGG